MREIKFRAWDGIKLKMYYYDCDSGYGLEVLKDRKFWKVMQYTGLKDYNKKDVYDGDIIKFTEIDEDSCAGREETHTVVVTWIDKIAQWRGVYPSGQRRELHLITNFDPVTDCDIIGNIYENPELIK